MKRKGGLPWPLIIGAGALAFVLFKWEWIKALIKKKVA